MLMLRPEKVVEIWQMTIPISFSWDHHWSVSLRFQMTARFLVQEFLESMMMHMLILDKIIYFRNSCFLVPSAHSYHDRFASGGWHVAPPWHSHDHFTNNWWRITPPYVKYLLYGSLSRTYGEMFPIWRKSYMDFFISECVTLRCVWVRQEIKVSR